MSLYRSETMCLYKITMQKDIIWEAVDEIGNLDILHMLDLNVDESPYSLPYTLAIKDCEASEKNI
jgi:hypothetical protein